jgi:hypothetical protein
MLYIILNGNKERIWHVGNPSPISHKEAAEVTEVQADGDELDHITYDIFLTNKSIPIPNRRVVRWFGDHAKLIAANLIK